MQVRWALATLGLTLAGVSLACSGPRRTEVVEVSGDGAAVTAAPALTYSENDWPIWRGPTGDGIAVAQTVPTEWSDSKNIAWQADVPGRGHSSPIVVGDAVYLATAVESSQKQSVLAFSRTTGEQLWECVVHEGGFPNNREVHNKATNANGTLAFADGQLFIAFLNQGKIQASAIDLQGTLVWQQEVGAFSSKFGYAPSPIPYRSLVIISADNQGGGYLAGLERATGKIVWRTSRPAVSSYSSPLLANIAGRDQLVISGCGKVTSFDPATGAEIWSCDAIAEGTCGTPVTDGTHVFAAGGYPERETVCIAADGSGRKVWSDRTKIYEPSLVTTQGNVYGVSDEGVAYCWSGKEGAVLWRERLGGSFSASAVVVGDKIFVSNLDGDTIVFAADPSGFKLISRNRLGSDCYASPAICGGEIFLRVGFASGGSRQERLVCIRDGG